METRKFFIQVWDNDRGRTETDQAPAGGREDKVWRNAEVGSSMLRCSISYQQ